MYPYGIATHQVVILSALWMHPQILLGVRKLPPPTLASGARDTTLGIAKYTTGR